MKTINKLLLTTGIFAGSLGIFRNEGYGQEIKIDTLYAEKKEIVVISYDEKGNQKSVIESTPKYIDKIVISKYNEKENAKSVTEYIPSLTHLRNDIFGDFYQDNFDIINYDSDGDGYFNFSYYKTPIKGKMLDSDYLLNFNDKTFETAVKEAFKE